MPAGTTRSNEWERPCLRCRAQGEPPIMIGTGTTVLESGSAVIMVVLRMAVTGIVGGSHKIPYGCGRLNPEGETHNFNPGFSQKQKFNKLRNFIAN